MHGEHLGESLEDPLVQSRNFCKFVYSNDYLYTFFPSILSQRVVAAEKELEKLQQGGTGHTSLLQEKVSEDTYVRNK